MATTEFTTPAGAGGQFLRLVTTVLSRAVALWQAYRNRRAIAHLLAFDEHMLRDIGVTAGDVRAAMGAPISDDPSRYLAAFARERRAAFRANAREGQARSRIRPVNR
jgi:uncharacterized protein YjiS (DUF1127 family)